MYPKKRNEQEGRLLSMTELQDYLNLGHHTAREVGESAGAIIKIGRRLLFDRKKIDAYIDNNVKPAI